MKTRILTTIAVIVAVLGLSSAKASSLDSGITVLSNLGKFQKIEVHGNVELTVATGDKNSAEVNDNYYAESALLQTDNGVLRITSYKKEKMVVYVTASDLRAISAYDNSTVKTDGKLSLIDLQVDLHNVAYAGLNLDNYAASIIVNDQAKADLTGNVTEYSLTYAQSSTVNRSELVAENSSENKVAPFEAPKHKHHFVA